MKLVFAIAVGESKHLEDQHFGEASHFFLLEFEDGIAKDLGALENPHRGEHGSGDHHSHGHGHGEGHGQKSLSLISMLEAQGVQVVVSTQYGPNIRRVCQHFVPVMAPSGSLETVKEQLSLFFGEIAAEWNDHPGWHAILRIIDGSLMRIQVKQ